MNLLSSRELVSPKDGFKIGMGFKITNKKGILMMVYGYEQEQYLYIIFLTYYL